jgi:Domain of unknown function (DUF4209)
MGILHLATSAPLGDPVSERQAAEEVTSGSISALFGHTTYSSDGRVVGKSGTASAVDRQMAHTRSWAVNAYVVGAILPALRQLRLEHVLPEQFFHGLAEESAVVPPGHKRLVGIALARGWNFRFAEALHVAVPQVEAIVRHHLKGVGAQTTTLDDDGVEMEVGLAALLERREVDEIFGDCVAYDLRYLFGSGFGANLRNDVAHGLLDDGQAAGSASAVYAWWLLLVLVTLPFWNRLKDEPPAENPEPESS